MVVKRYRFGYILKIYSGLEILFSPCTLGILLEKCTKEKFILQSKLPEGLLHNNLF